MRRGAANRIGTGELPGRGASRHAIAVTLLTAYCLLPTAYCRAEEPPDPLPLERVILPPERIAGEMKRLGEGQLKQLSREEFEDLVRRAGRAAAAARKQPRLLATRYRARVVNGDLVGTAEWQVLNPGAAPAVLALAPLNLALRQPHFGKQPAVIGELDSPGPGLLLEQAGEQALAFDWSARGEQRPEGLAFALEVPPCPLAALELDVPADLAPAVASDGCLLTRPQPAEAPDRRRWVVEFAGRSQVRLLLHKAEGPGSRPALVLATQTTRQRVTPDAVEAVFSFDLKALHQPVRELRCECDPSLRPYQVLAGAPSEDGPHPVETWQFQPGAGAAPATLTVRLAEPLQGGTLEVRALAPLGRAPGTARWTSPWLRLAGAVPRGESLELRFHPEVHLEDWQPGGFRLTQSRADAEGWHVLTLTGGALASGPGADRPGARLTARGVEFRARELLWWQVAPRPAAPRGPAERQPSLVAQLTCDVVRGRLFQLPLVLPPGWQLDHLQSSPADLLRGPTLHAENGRTVLTVELQHPVAARPAAEGPAAPEARPGGGTVRLTVWLRPSGPPPAPAGGAVAYPFPDVVPLGATWREGGLGLDFDEGLYEAEVRTAAPAGTPDEEGPWGQQVPGHFYPYRGRPVQGTLVLRPRRGRLRARCTSTVGLTPDRMAVTTRLLLQPEVGAPSALDVLVSAPLEGRWQWRTEGGGNAVQGFERLREAEAAALLAPLAARRALDAATLLAAAAGPGSAWRGERWRLTLARPLRAPLVLEASYELPRGDGGPVDVPLLVVPAAAHMEGEVRLYLSGTSLVQAEAAGLQEPPAPAGARGNAPPWRVFRYGPGLPSLRLRGRGPAVSPSPGPALTTAALTAHAGTDGRLLVYYRFQVWNWQQRTFPVRLPRGARLLAARVDGRWVGAPVPAPEGEASGTADAEVSAAELPVPVGAAARQYELVYSLRQPPWCLWTDLEAAEPLLPLDLKAPACRRTWFLAPGVVPLEGACRLPGFPGAGRLLPALTGPLESAWRRWDPASWFGAGAPGSAGTSSWQTGQRLRLEDAAREVGQGSPATLGQAVERLALEGLKGEDVLVLDAEALREAGLGPAAPLPASGDRPFWEAVGLAYVPCAPAPVLTTRRQAQAWEADARADLAGAALAPAVAEAVLAGHDRSGRFHRATDWLRAAGPDGAESVPSGPLLPGPLGPGWSAWEPAAGAAGPLRLVRQDVLPLTGGVLAALLALAFWRAGRASGRRLALLLVWLGASFLALLWLPPALDGLAWGPLLVGLVLSLVWHLVWVFRTARPRPDPGSRPGSSGARPAGAAPRSGVIVPLLLLMPLAGALLPARAAPPSPAVVFLIPGPADAPDRQSVLAPPQLLEQLDALTRRGTYTPHGAVLTAADYQGTVAGGVAHFTATFVARSFEDGPANLALPLVGVQLEDVLVDGTRAAPQAAPAGGYVVPLQGKGDHALTLRFQVPVQAAGADRDLQFAAPRLAQARLKLEVPDGSHYLQALARQGALSLSPSGTRLEVELGQAATPLHFRWRQDAGPVPPQVKVEELYLWELGATASSLSAVLQYRIAGGPVDSLSVQLPALLDVRSVEVAANGGEEPKPRLKDWSLLGPAGEDQPRQLRLDFRGPLTAGVQVVLDLVPRRPLGARALLPLPAPLGAETTGGYVAYRLDGLREVERSFQRVKPVEPEEFLRRWKQAPVSVPAGLAYAGQLARHPAAAPLELQLAVQPVRFDATQDLAWRVGPAGADLRATLRLTAPDGDLAFVEWEVPESVTVTRVSGPDVFRWGRSGSRLQVWLQRPLRTAEVQLSGWWLPPQAAGRPENGPRPAYTLELPHLWLPAARAQATALHLTAADGLAVTRLRSQHLDSWPDTEVSDQDLSFLARQPEYGGSFAVRPAAGADVRILTTAELRDRQVTFLARLDCRGRRGKLRPLTVRLRNWEGEQVQLLDAPEVAQVHEQGRGPAERSWAVDFRPGTTGPVRLALTGSLPLDEAAAGVPMPDVSVDGPRRSETWLAVAGPDLVAEDARGLTPLAGAGALQPFWPEEASRVRAGHGPVWRVAAPAGEWRLRLRPRRRAATAAAARVFLTEQSAAVTDGRHWAHQTTYALYHEASTDLRVKLPQGATVLGVAVDGAAVTPLQTGSDASTLWLPLAGGAGVRSLRLRWTYPEDAEPLEQPNLAAPLLEGARQDGPVLWKVEVPRGYVLETMPGAGPARPASSAGQDLRRAEAQLRLAEALAGQVQGPGDALASQLAAARRRFADDCRFAERELAAPAPGPAPGRATLLARDENQAALIAARRDDRGPDGQTLGEWLDQLRARERQLAQPPAGAESPAPAEENTAPAGERAAGPFAAALPERGTPLCWHADAASTVPPAVRLVTLPARQAQRAAAASLLLLALVLAAWLLSLSPAALRWLRAAWPEQALLLAALAWLLAGLPLLAVVLLVIAVCGRLFWLAGRLLAWLTRPAPAASVPGSGVAST